MDRICKTPRVPKETPMFDERGLLTRTWIIFFERLGCCCEPAAAAAPEPEPDPEAFPASYRFHAYTKRDGRLYLNRLEIDTGKAKLKSILIEVHYEDEAHGAPDRVQVSEYEISLDHDLMGTGARTAWERAIELPQASVSKVGVKIRCSAGDTGYVYAWPVGADSLQCVEEPDPGDTPDPVRTMGHKQYQMAMRMLAPMNPGATLQSIENAYETLKATEPQTFYRAYAEISDFYAHGGSIPPVDISGTVSRLEPLGFDGNTGTITLDGEPGPATITLRVTGDAEVACVATINATSLDALATALADAINDSLFGAYFEAEATDNEVGLKGLKNYIGTLTATVESNTVTVEAEGITPAEDMLDIQKGRKYVVQFEADGGISPGSPLSATTGPVRGRNVKIHGIPPAGDDITGIKILAAPDGQDGPFTVVASVTPGDAFAVDTTISVVGADEAEGECETRDGKVYVTVKRHGADWFTLLITSDKQRSEIIPALDLGRIEENTIISADLRYVLDLPPTLDKPGRPCDVRVVIE